LLALWSPQQRAQSADFLRGGWQAHSPQDMRMWVKHLGLGYRCSLLHGVAGVVGTQQALCSRRQPHVQTLEVYCRLRTSIVHPNATTHTQRLLRS
jgi:hypothetical protein